MRTFALGEGSEYRNSCIKYLFVDYFYLLKILSHQGEEVIDFNKMPQYARVEDLQFEVYLIDFIP